jgi:hypothetical protein
MLADHRPLEFSEGAQHLEQRLAGWFEPVKASCFSWELYLDSRLNWVMNGADRPALEFRLLAAWRREGFLF